MLEQGQPLPVFPFHTNAGSTWATDHNTSGPPTSHRLYPYISNVPQSVEILATHKFPPSLLQKADFYRKLDYANARHSHSWPRTRLQMTCMTHSDSSHECPCQSRELSLNVSGATGQNALINVNIPEAYRYHLLGRGPESLPAPCRRHNSCLSQSPLGETMTSTNTYAPGPPLIPEGASNLVALRLVDPATNRPPSHVFHYDVETTEQTMNEISSSSFSPNLNLSPVSSSWLPSHPNQFSPTVFTLHTQDNFSLQSEDDHGLQSPPSCICDSGDELDDGTYTLRSTETISVSPPRPVQPAQANYIPEIFHDQYNSPPVIHSESTHPPDKVSRSPVKRSSNRRSSSAATRSSLQRKKKSKMHECEVCHKFFPRPSGLSTHKNSHSGNKPYPCEVPECTRFFTVRSNAKRHLSTHGIFPQRCKETTTPYTVGFITPTVLPVEHPSSNIPRKLRWVASLVSPPDSIPDEVVEQARSQQGCGAAIWKCVAPQTFNATQNETSEERAPDLETTNSTVRLSRPAIVLRTPVSL